MREESEIKIFKSSLSFFFIFIKTYAELTNAIDKSDRKKFDEMWGLPHVQLALILYST
jgi:hypothetical protein